LGEAEPAAPATCPNKGLRQVGEVIMVECAYCDCPCQQTREHVIPRWYNDTPGESETFSARAPLTHVQGDVIVKDVCGACNSGILGELDGYGKELYERSFAGAVYAGESVKFEYDGDRLVRWLLKLSYNSARAQNADVRVLREYRKVMLGASPVPDRIRCWLHLVPPTLFEASAKVARPARRDEQGQPGVEEPLWFRIGQFRLPSYEALPLVQRTVLINSFAFTLLIARADSEWPSPEFDEWIKVFSSLYPQARPILPGMNSPTVTAGDVHAAATMYFSVSNYPTRFSDQKNPFVAHALTSAKDDVPVVFLQVPRELVELGDTAPITSALRDMVSTREKAAAFRQRVGLMVNGFDDDPRAIWQFPEACEFFRRLFVECPFVMLLAHPDRSLLKLLAACWVYEDGITEEVEQQRTADFLNRAFRGLNSLNHILMLSEEQNREICKSASKALFGEVPPMM
jgi:hypothetical protein